MKLTIPLTGKVVFDFYADWCMPCKMLKPVIEKVRQERKDIQVVEINADENKDAVAQFGVTSMPTLIFFKDGIQICEKKGPVPYASFVEPFNEQV